MDEKVEFKYRFEDVIDAVDSIYVPATAGLLQVPLGANDDGSIKYVMLNQSGADQHISVSGVTGSGKSMAVTFILSSLSRMYGRNLKVHYIDGQAVEYSRWKQGHKWLIPKRGVFGGFTSTHELISVLHTLIQQVASNRLRQLIVFDDISHMVSTSPGAVELLTVLAEIGPKHNTHLLIADQNSLLGNVAGGFAVRCATRLRVPDSVAIFGSDIAYSGVRRYGDIVIKAGDEVSVYNLPFTTVRALM